MQNVIFTTYYATKKNPQRTAKKAIPNDFEMIRGWYESACALGLYGIIFHDHLTESFTKKYTNEYVSFIPVPFITERSVNDERFYLYHKELTLRPEIENLLCTDLFDVVFYKSPFGFISDDNMIYVGSENPKTANFHVIKNNCIRAYGGAPKWWHWVDAVPLNAGLIGGRRKIMLDLFANMIKEFESIDIKINANMFILNKCLHASYISFVTGFPFHSEYRGEEKEGSFYIKHK